LLSHFSRVVDDHRILVFDLRTEVAGRMGS
jgi:hypothetical protein